MTDTWRTLHSYPSNTPALFWVNSGLHEFAVWGVLTRSPTRPGRHVCDPNGYVFALEEDIEWWRPCERPPIKQRCKLTVVHG
jgi:hypothetical protein